MMYRPMKVGVDGGTDGSGFSTIALAGRLGLFRRIMDQRLVDYRQHLLWHRLGRRQDPGAEPGHRKDGFAHGFGMILFDTSTDRISPVRVSRNRPVLVLPAMRYNSMC